MKILDFLFLRITIYCMLFALHADLSFGQSVNNLYILTRTMQDDAGSIYTDKIEYFDGLGRPMETVLKNFSPSKNDIVTYQQYDGVGRQNRQWEPVPIAGSGAYADLPAVISTSQSFYHDSKAYQETIYENSPLNRIQKIMGSGEAWHHADRAIKTAYLTNTAAGVLACALFEMQIDRTSIQNKGLYSPSQLYVTQITDEDNHIVYEFKDKQNHLVLKRVMNGNIQQDTYFVYDNFGRLRYVLPPAATDLLTDQNVSWNTSNNQAMMDFAYYYQYDGHGNCILKKLPGCAPIRMVYDRADRMIFSQDGNQKLKNEWTFFLYDAFGRQTVTGQLVSVLPTDVGNVVVLSTFSATGSLAGYTANISIPFTNIVSVNYYDDYRFIDLQSAQEKSKLVFVSTPGYDAQYTGGTKGLMTGTRTYQFNVPEKYTVSANYYDHRGRIVQTHATNHLGGFDDDYFSFTFTGKVTGHRHVHSAAGQPTQTEIYSYTYDHAERLLMVSHKLNDNTAIVIAENKYDEIGRLKTKKTPAETTNYSYNVRGWMTQATGTKFKETLAYNDVVNGLSPSIPYYGGNISAMKWQAGDETIERQYQFKYDNKGQLKGSNYSEELSRNITPKYEERFAYDKMGNIKSFIRTAPYEGGESVPVFDNIHYQHNGNQLTAAESSGYNPPNYGDFNFVDGAHAETEYKYDANGNLTQDFNKKISKIEYNSLNLPSRLQFSYGHLAEYAYDAAGRKLSVTYHTSKTNLLVPMGSIVPPQATNVAMTLKTDYCGNMIYENGELKMIRIDGGYIVNNDEPIYYHYVQDHLGNNRVVVRNDGYVEQVNHYYPFGGLFEGFPSIDMDQPYKYNGKELDRMHGLNWYDYGARHYDAALCRWTTMDPLAEKYYDVSPYAYCHNNPVNRIDPDGRNPIYNTAGKYLGCSSEGYTGIIYVYKGSDIIDFSKEKMAYWTDPDRDTPGNFSTYDSFENSLKGKEHGTFVSNVMTDLASHFNGTRVFDDKTFDISTLKDNRITFSENYKSNFTTLGKHDGIKTSIDAHGRTQESYEGTVENFASTIIVHEWFSHGEYKIGSQYRNHSQAYMNIMNDKIFYPKTTNKYKDFIKTWYEKYKSNERKR